MTRAAADLLDTDPITLTEASELVLRGAVSVSALRAEVRRGNLAVERIGKNLYTTPEAIREMRTKCRVRPHHQGYISERTGRETSGSSATTDTTSALDALNQTVRALKGGSLNTSPKSMRRDPQKAASPIPFPSRT